MARCSASRSPLIPTTGMSRARFHLLSLLTEIAPIGVCLLRRSQRKSHVEAGDWIGQWVHSEIRLRSNIREWGGRRKQKRVSPNEMS